MSCADKDRPSTWVKYREGLCRDCNAGCCTMPVEVKVEDLLRLGLIAEDELRASPKKILKRLARDGLVKSYRASTQLYMLEQKSNSDCIFLDDKRLCTVYERRPDVCRQFPSIGPRPTFCPYTRKVPAT